MGSTFQFSLSKILFGVAFSFAAICVVPIAGQILETATQSKDDPTAGLRVSEPVTFKNLAVYFIHSDTRDDREYLTLNEGLKQGLVVVTEKKQEQVSELLIENKSDKPLFLQEGDRVTGGKQDRTIYSSLVIKAKSGLMPIPTFCVEQSRWAVGEKGKSFGYNLNPAYASNAVRAASKLSKDQSEVWRQVGNSKSQLQFAIGNSDKTTSLNESLDSKKATESLKPFVDALKNASDKHKDLVGIAFAIDGHIQEINVYPSCSLVKQVYPRLLQTYALDAIVKAHQRKKTAELSAQQKPVAGSMAQQTAQPLVQQSAQQSTQSSVQTAIPQNFQAQVAVPQSTTTVAPKPVQPTPSGESVLAMMRTKVKPKAEREEQVNADNRLQINQSELVESGEQLFRCQTDYQKKPFHLQWLRAEKGVASSSGIGRGGPFQNYTIDFNQNLQRGSIQTDSTPNVPQTDSAPRSPSNNGNGNRR